MLPISERRQCVRRSFNSVSHFRSRRRSEAEQRQPRNDLSAQCSNVGDSRTRKFLSRFREVVATFRVEVEFDFGDLVVSSTHEFDHEQVGTHVEPTTTSTPDFFPRSTTDNAQVARWTRWTRFGSRLDEERFPTVPAGRAVAHELPTLVPNESVALRRSRVRSSAPQPVIGVPVSKARRGRFTIRTWIGVRFAPSTPSRTRQ